jgi:hypothetical protein
LSDGRSNLSSGIEKASAEEGDVVWGNSDGPLEKSSSWKDFEILRCAIPMPKLEGAFSGFSEAGLAGTRSWTESGGTAIEGDLG